MAGDIDPRLIGLLQAVMGFADALRDAGTGGDINLRLTREDGLLLLKLVSGANGPEAEAWSQRGRPRREGLHSLKMAGVTLEWPQAEPHSALATISAGVFSSAPRGVGLPSNDNGGPGLLRFYGFEEEKPALL